MSSTTSPRPSSVSQISELIAMLPALLALFGQLKALFPKRESKPVPNPITTGPDPVQPWDYDDKIPPRIPPPVVVAPSANPPVSGKFKIYKIQLNRERFPNAPNNGTYSGAEMQAFHKGQAMPFDSKFWTDLTLFDATGAEFTPERVEAEGLCFNTFQGVTGPSDAECSIRGAGWDGVTRDANGHPVPRAGYQTEETDDLGMGISSWIAGRGFTQQWKAFSEGPYTGRAVALPNGLEVPLPSFTVS